MQRALALFVVAACASEPAPPPPAAPAPAPVAVSRDRKLIEKAYAAHDARTLKELLEFAGDADDRARARDLYVKLQLDALVALDCDAFVAAFEPVRGKPNPKTELGSLTAELAPAAKAYIASTVLGVAARCRAPLVFSPAIRRVAPDAEDRVWSDALVALDRKGLPVYDAFVRALKSPSAPIDAALADAWLAATDHCKELAAVPRAANRYKGCPERVAR